MTGYRVVALLSVLAGVAVVGIWFRRSKPVLIGGLLVVGAATLVALLTGAVTPRELGLAAPHSWLATVGAAVVWTAVLIAYSPVADAVARRRFPERPDLGAFDVLRQSRIKLAAGIVVAWVLGGFLEELTFRGIVLQSVDAWLVPVLPRAVAATVAVLVAAPAAAVAHLYQGPRAAVVIVQLSGLLGLLMVLGGHNLWTVVICHGLYDTVAFVRYARGTSRYAVR